MLFQKVVVVWLDRLFAGGTANRERFILSRFSHLSASKALNKYKAYINFGRVSNGVGGQTLSPAATMDSSLALGLTTVGRVSDCGTAQGLSLRTTALVILNEVKNPYGTSRFKDGFLALLGMTVVVSELLAVAEQDDFIAVMLNGFRRVARIDDSFGLTDNHLVIKCAVVGGNDDDVGSVERLF